LNELWIIYGLIFGAALLGIEAGYVVLVRERKTQRSVNRRLKLSAQGASQTVVLDALRNERGFADFGNVYLGRLSDFWTQTGLRFDRNLLLVAAGGVTILYFIILIIPLGFAMSPLIAIFAVVAAVATVVVFLNIVRSSRIARFREQFPDSLDVIVRGVRVGLPFSSALSLVAKEMPDPVGTEFGMTADEIAFGLGVPKALENLHRRVGQEDLLYFVIAITIQAQTGGGLSELLARLSRLIRQRTMLRLKVKALTAEGRITAIVLSAMPFLLFGVISLLSPDYFTSVLDNPLVPPAVALALLSLAIGNLMVYRMVNFKY
jgi:tight adherence protein B